MFATMMLLSVPPRRETVTICASGTLPGANESIRSLVLHTCGRRRQRVLGNNRGFVRYIRNHSYLVSCFPHFRTLGSLQDLSTDLEMVWERFEAPRTRSKHQVVCFEKREANTRWYVSGFGHTRRTASTYWYHSHPLLTTSDTTRARGDSTTLLCCRDTYSKTELTAILPLFLSPSLAFFFCRCWTPSHEAFTSPRRKRRYKRVGKDPIAFVSNTSGHSPVGDTR
jgi:hypothetical protein